MFATAQGEEFRGELMRTQNEYKVIAQEAAGAIQNLGGTPRELPAWTRMATWGAVRMETAFDSSCEKMSKMVLKGMNMAQVGMNDAHEQYPQADACAHSLADRVLELQNAHRGIYQKYLS